MSGRKSRKSQKLGSSRRNANRSNNRDTEEKESDDGNPQTGHEEHKSEQQIVSHTITQNPSDDASLHQPDQAKTTGISQQTSPSELHIQSQEGKDLLTQAEAASKKRKMGSTRKSRGFKGGEIPEEEPEQNLGVCEENKEEHEETKKQSAEVRKSKEDNDRHVLSDYSSCQPTKPESLSLQSATTGISSHDHELLEGATFSAESTSRLSVGKPTENTVPSHEIHLTLSQVHQQVETLPDSTGLKVREQGSDDSLLCENWGNTESPSESISEVLHQHWTVDPEEQGITLISSNAYDFLKDSQESQYAQIHSVINQSSINIMHQDIQEREHMFPFQGSTAETKESFGKEHEQEYSNSSEKTVYSTRDGSEEEWQNATQTKTENDIFGYWLENKNETLPEDLECINDELQSSEYRKGNEDHKDEHSVEDRNECADKVEVKHPVQPTEPNENSTLSPIQKNLEDRPSDRSLVVVCDSSSEMQHDCSVGAVDENTEKTEESLKGHDSEEDNKTFNICPKTELLDSVTEEKITSSETVCEEVAEEMNIIKQGYNLSQNNSEEISLELEMQRKEESDSKQESRFCDETPILLCDKERGCDLAENENQNDYEEIRLSKNRDDVVDSDKTFMLTMTNANVPESTDIQTTENITLSAYDRQEGVSEDRVHAAAALTTDHINGPAEIISPSLAEQLQTGAGCIEEDIRYIDKEEVEGVVQLVSTLAKEDGAVKDYSGQTGPKNYRTGSPTYSGEYEENNTPHLSEEQFKAVEVTPEPVTNSTDDLTEDECKTSSCFTQEKWLDSCDTLTERREQELEDGIENDVAIKCKNISQEHDETLTTVFECAENKGKVQDCSAKPECDVFDSEVMTNTPVMVSNVLVHQTECVIHNEETKAKVLVEKETHEKTALDDEKSNDSTASNDQKIPQTQNDAATFIESSQEMSIVVEEYDKENVSQVLASLTSGTMEDILETQDNVDIPGNAENIQEMISDQTAQLPWDYDRSRQSKKKKRFGSTRKPQGGHRPDNEGEERKLEDTEAAEEIEHDVEERCSPETSHHEVLTDLLTESTDETEEYRSSNMSHATLTDTDVQPVVCKASKSEGLVEMMSVQENTVLEDERVDDSDEQEMPHIIKDMQNKTYTHHAVSQEMSEVVEEHDEENNESGSPNQVHVSLTSGTMEVIPKTIDNEEEERKMRDDHDVEERCSDESTLHEITTDLLTETQSDVSDLPLSMLDPPFEKEICKSTDEIGIHGKLVEETMELKEDQTICPAEDSTNEQQLLPELSSQTAELSLPTNTQPSPVTEPSESEPDDGNDHGDVEIKITELHPQSQSKKKKRFGSTRKPQGGHRPDNEGEERKLADTEAAEEIEHDVEERCSPETTHHEVLTDLSTESTDETGEYGKTDMSHATLTDTDVQPVVNEATKTEGLGEMINVHEKKVLEDEKVDDSNEQIMPNISTDMQNNTYTHHDVSQEMSVVVEGHNEENNENGSPNQVHVSLTIGTMEVIPKRIDNEEEERKMRDTDTAERIEHDVEERCSDETTLHEVTTDLLTETQSDMSELPLSMLGPAFEKEISKSTDEIGVHGKLVEETMELKEDQTICPAEDSTNEQHLLSDLSSQTEISHHEVPTDLLTESTDKTGEYGSTNMAHATLTDIDVKPTVNEASKTEVEMIEVHEKTVLEDETVDDFESTDEQKMPVITTDMQNNTFTHHDVSQEMSVVVEELDEDSREYGSSSQVHTPSTSGTMEAIPETIDNEREERKIKDTEAAEEIEHDVKEICSPETTHHEVPTDLFTESTDETEECGKTDMSHATLKDTDVQSVVYETSKTEGLVEMIEVPEKPVLEEEMVDDSESTDEQKMPSITTDMQNNTSTHHDVSQEMSGVVKDNDEENNESGSPNQLHAPLTSGPIEVIPNAIDNEEEERKMRDAEAKKEIKHDVEERYSDVPTHHEVTTDLLTESQSEVNDLPLSVLGPALEKEISKSTDETGEFGGIDISSAASLDIDVHSVDRGVHKAEGLVEVIGVHGKLVDESMEPKEDQTICPAEDSTKEQHLPSELSSQTAELSLPTNIQPSPVTEFSDLKTDDVSDHENVEMKITELHPQSQSKKKKRFGSTRKPQGGHRPDTEGEERQLKDTEAAEETEHDVKERCSSETSHHDLFTESTDETEEYGKTDMSHATLTETDVQPVVCETSKTEGLVEMIEVHEKTVLEEGMVDDSETTDEQKMPLIPTDMQNNTSTHHDVSQEISVVVKELNDDNKGNGSPSQVHAPLPSGTLEVIAETHDSVDIPVNTENNHEAISDLTGQIPQDHSISEDNLEKTTHKESENPTTTIQESVTIQDNVITENAEMITSGKRRTRRSHREQLHGGDKEKMNEKEEYQADTHDETSKTDDKSTGEETIEPKEDQHVCPAEDPTTEDVIPVSSEQHVLSDLSFQTAELSLTTNMQPSPLTKPSECKSDDGNDHENVEMKITELHPQSQSKKKKRFGSTRKPQGGHRPDNVGEERKLKDKEAAEEIGHDVKERYSEETPHHELITELPSELTDETGEYRKTDMSHATLTDTDVQPIVFEASETEGLVEIINVRKKTVLEDETVDDSDEQKMPHITIDMQNETSTHHDVSQEVSEVVEEHDEENNESGSPNQVHSPLTSGTMEVIPKTIDNEREKRKRRDTEAADKIEHDVGERCSEETTHHEVTTDLLSESQSDMRELTLSMLGPALDKEIARSTNETGEFDGIDMSSDASTDIDVHAFDHAVNKAEGLVEVIGVHGQLVEESMEPKEDQTICPAEDQEVSEVVEKLDEDNHEYGSPNQVHASLTNGTMEIIPKTIDTVVEERKLRDTEAAEENEHDVEERCSGETTLHEVTADLLTETQSDMSELPLSMLGPALEIEIFKSTDEIGVHGKLVEETMELKEDQTICPAEDPITEQYLLSDLSSQTAELSSTHDTQPSTVTEPSESEPDAGNDYDDIEMKIKELHPQSQSKKKKRFGSTRKPQGRPKPDTEGKERKMKDTEAAEEIEHDVEERCSPETTHHEVTTNLLTESADETGECGKTDMSNATLTDTDVQPVVNEASKTEGLVELIKIHDKTVLENEKFDDFESTDEQKMPHITTDMQNDTYKHHDVSQEISVVVEELDEDNHEYESPSQVHAPLPSGTVEVIAETHDNVDILVNTENSHEVISDLTGQIPQEHNVSEDNLEKTTHKESENTTTLIHIQESVTIQDNVITETPELSTSGKRRKIGSTRRSHREQLHGGDKKKMTKKEENQTDTHDETSKTDDKFTEEETLEPKEDQHVCPIEDHTTENITPVCLEQHLLSELSSLTAELSLTTNIQPSPVTEPSESKSDDGNVDENVEMKNTELHPQSQSKKKKRFGSTRKPQGGHRPDNEEEERQWKDTEAAEETEHDVEEICSPETSHHDLFTELTDETGEHGKTDMSHATLTDTGIQPVVCKASKTEGLVEIIEVHGKSVLEGEKVDDFESTNEQKMPHITTDMQNNTSTHHDVSQEVSEVVEEHNEDNNENGSPNQVHAPPPSGTVEVIPNTIDNEGEQRKLRDTEAAEEIERDVEERRSDETTLHEVTTDLLNESQSDMSELPLSMLGPAFEKEISKSTDEIGVHGKLVEETMELKEDQNICPAEDSTTEQQLLPDLSSQTAELSLTHDTQPSTVTEPSESVPDDGNDHDDVEMKITELHPQSQSKKKKRFGSTRKPQGRPKPDNEGKERKIKDTEAAEEIEHDVEERCSPETSHHEVLTDLLTESTDETGECGKTDMSNAILADTDVQPVVNEASKTEGLVEMIKIHDKTVLENEKFDDSDEQKMPHITTDMQKETYTHHDVSQEVSVEVEELDEDNHEYESPSQVHAPLPSGTVEFIAETHDSVDILVNTENSHEVLSDLTGQIPQDHNVSKDNLEKTTHKESENTTTLIHIQESVTIQDNVITEIPELSTSGKRRTRRSTREQLNGGDKEKINEKQKIQADTHDETSKTEEETLEPKEDQNICTTEDPTSENVTAVCSEQNVLSELSSQTAELSLTTDTQPTTVTKSSDSKTDDGNDHENVEMKITELHPQSQSKKKKRFGSTRKPQGGHRPDTEGEERKWRDTEAAEEIEHDVEEIHSPGTSHHEVPTDLLTELTEATGEYGKTDMSHATLADTDVQLVVNEASKTEGLVEMIEVHEKTVLEDETVDDSESTDEQKMPHITTDMQNNTSTHHDVSQEVSKVVQELHEDNRENGSPNQVHAPLASGTIGVIAESHDSVDIPVNTENSHETISDLTDQIPQDHNVSEDNLEKTTHKESENTTTLIHIQESVTIQDNVITETPELSTSGKRRTQRSTREQLHGGDKEKINEKQKIQADTHDETSKTEEETLEQKEDQYICTTEDPTSENVTAVCSEQNVLSELSSQKAELSLTTNIQPTPVTKSSDSKTDDGNDHDDVEMKITELHHQTQSKKKKRFGSTRKPQGGHRPDKEGKERKLADTEAAEEIEHDVEERCSPETSHHEVLTDLLTESTDETGEHGKTDMSHATLTDTDVHPVVNEASKTEGLVEMIEVHEKTVLEDETIDDSDKQKMPHITTDMQNNTSTHHDVSQEISVVVEEHDEDNNENGSPDQVHAPLPSGTVEVIAETHDNVDIPVNTENSHEVLSDPTGQIPQDQSISEDNLEKTTHKESENTTTLIHIQESVTIQDNVITETPELSTSGKRRKIGSTRRREPLHGGDKKKINEKEENQIDTHDETSKTDDKLPEEETLEPKEDQHVCNTEDPTSENVTPVSSEQHVLSELSSQTAELSFTTNIQPTPVTKPSDSKTDDGNDHENVEMKNTELHPQSQSKKKKRFGSTRKPQGGHRPDTEGEERQLKDTEAAEEIEHDVKEICSPETTLHEATTDLLNESQSDVSELLLSMLGPALEKEISKLTDEIGIHGKLVEETMEPKEHPTTEQNLLSESSSQTAELSLTTDTQPSTVTEPSDSKPDDVSDHENVEMKITELHPQSQSKKKKRFGSTRKPQGGHRPDNEGEERKLEDTEAAEEIEHDVEERCSPETSHHEVPTDLLTESTDETGECGKTDISNAILADTDVQLVVNEASKTEGLVEMIKIHDKTVLENEKFDDSDEQKMPHITTDMQNNTSTHHDVSQEISVEVEELDEDNHEYESPSQVHAPLPSGTVEFIAETHDNVDIPVNTENSHEVISDLTGQIPQDHNVSEDNLEKTTHKESENTTTLIHIQESVTIQDNVITEIPELSTSGKRKTRRSTREQLNGGDKEKINEKQKIQADTHDETSKTEEETLEPKEDQNICTTEDPTSENVTAVCSEQNVLSELSSQTAELSFTTNIQPTSVIKSSDSKTDDGNDHENVEMKITELHPQSQSKKKKRFGSTRKPQGGHRPDKEGEERKLEDTEAAEDIEHDVEERCSPETTHHEVLTDLLTESTDETGEHGKTDMSHATLTDTDVHPVVNEASKTEGLVEMIEVHEKTVLEDETIDDSDKQKMPHITTDMQNNTSTHHDVSQEISVVVEEHDEDNNENGSPNQVHAPLPSGTLEVIAETHDNVDIPVNTENSHEVLSDPTGQIPQDQSISEDNLEKTTHKESENTTTLIHIQESVTIQDNVITETPELSTSGKRRKIGSTRRREPLHGGDKKKINEKEENQIDTHDETSKTDDKLPEEETLEPKEDQHVCNTEDPTSENVTPVSSEQHVLSDLFSQTAELSFTTNIQPTPVTKPSDSKTDDGNDHENVEMKNTELHPQSQSKKKKRFGSTRKPQGGHRPDTEGEERQLKDTEAAEEIEHDVKEICSPETSHHEATTDLLNESQSDVSELLLSMLGPALEKEISKLTDEIGIHGKLVEETMEPKEHPTTEQNLLSESSSQTAELSLTTDTQPSTVTEPSDSKPDDVSDHENVEMKITELHPQSQSKKKKRFGSTRKPQGGHRPDNEGEERKWRDTKASEEIEHDVVEICSPETSHHEVPTDLLTESTDETGECGKTDMSNATLADTDVQLVVNEASKTEGLLEIIKVHEKSVLENEMVDDFESTDEQKMPHITTHMQNDTYTHHDVSQEVFKVVEAHDEENNESGNFNQVHFPSTSGTVEVIAETHDSVDIPVNTENNHEAISDLTGQIPQDHNVSKDNLEKTTHKESENTTTLIHIQESVTIQDNVITETPELSTSGKRRTRRSIREQLHGGDKKKINELEENKEKRYIEENDLYLIERSCISGTNSAEKLTEEETMEPEDEISASPTEVPTTEDFTALGSEQHVLSELSFQTAELSLTTNTQPSPVTEPSDSKKDSRNDNENVQMKTTELHPQSQNKKKKRFGSTRRPQGGPRPDNEGEERKWKDTEAAEETEHDVDKKCSPEISHHEVPTDLLTKSHQSDLSGSLSVINPSPEKEIADSTDKTGECERFPVPFVALTNTFVHNVDHEVRKEDGLLENSEVPGKPVLEVKEIDDTESLEVNTETHDKVGIPVNAENIHEFTSDQVKQLLHHNTSEVHPEEPTDREPESTSLAIHIQEIKTTEGSVIAQNPELNISGKRRKIGSTRRGHREQLHGGGRKTINEKEENICEKDKNRNFEDTKNVKEEGSMEANKEESTIHTKGPTTEDFPAACSEHVLPESSSQTAELSLSTNIQPSQLLEHPGDGNDHENVDMKITELHPQSQSKKKKRFGSTRKPQGGHRPDTEGEERQWRDTEAAEEIEHDVEEICSKETTHYEMSTDLLIESQSDMSGPSLSMLDPPLEKVTAESPDETGECEGVDMPSVAPAEVEKIDDSKSSEINVQIHDSIELEKTRDIIQSHTSTGSLTHTQESNTIQDNVIPESSELSTSGKRRKIGSTRKSHREQLHGRDKKKINEEEVNQGAKDDEERFGEESAFNLADRSIKSGTKLVIEEESMSAKEEIGASQTEDPTTENVTTVCSEQHVLSEVSSQTAELSLPTPVSEPSDSKSDDGNDHENVEMKTTELHPQSQSKKKKRFGSTRKPQGGHRPDNEEEERQWKDTEAAEENEHDVEEICSPETSHHDLFTESTDETGEYGKTDMSHATLTDTDVQLVVNEASKTEALVEIIEVHGKPVVEDEKVLTESQSDLSGLSLCVIDPSLEKETQLQNAATDLHLQDFKNLQCVVISEKSELSTSGKRRKMGSTRRNPREQHLRDDQKETTEELKEEDTTKEQELEESTAVTQEASLEAETLRNLISTSNTETAHPSIATELSVSADSVNLVIPEVEKMDKKRRKMGSTRKSYKGGDRMAVLGETGGMDSRADEDMEDTLLHDTAFGWGITANTTGQDTEPQIHHMFDKSEGSLLNEIEFELNMSCQLSHTAPAISESSLNNTLSPYTLSENPQPAAEQCMTSSELQHSQNSQNPQNQAEISSPARRRKMGSTRKTPKSKQTEDIKDESLETEHQAGNLDKIELGREKAKDMLTVKMTEDEKESVEIFPKVHDSSASTELPPPGSKRKFGSRRTAKGSRNLSGLPPDEFDPDQEKPGDTQVLSDELTVCDPYFTSGPQSTLVSQPVADDNMEASLGKEHVNDSAVNKADVSTEAGLVSLDDLRKSALYNGSTGKREKIDFERWSEQIPDFGVAVYNVVMVGNSSVGKTSFMNRLQSGHFSPDYCSTIGVDTCVQTIALGGRTVKLHVWDTAGQERYHSITRQVFHKAQGLLLMYDITSSESFCAVRNWVTQIKECAPDDVIMILLGNKNDCAERKVQLQEGEDLSREYKIHFLECSAATGENVEESMKTLACLLVKQNVRREEDQTILQPKPAQQKSGCC